MKMNKKSLLMLGSLSLSIVPVLAVVSCSNEYEWSSKVSPEFSIVANVSDILADNNVKAWIDQNQYDTKKFIVDEDGDNPKMKPYVIIHKIKVVDGIVCAFKTVTRPEGREFKKGKEIEMKMIVTGTLDAPTINYYIDNKEVAKKDDWKIFTGSSTAKITIQEIARW